MVTKMDDISIHYYCQFMSFSFVCFLFCFLRSKNGCTERNVSFVKKKKKKVAMTIVSESSRVVNCY